jgi:hypothetical protein
MYNTARATARRDESDPHDPAVSLLDFTHPHVEEEMDRIIRSTRWRLARRVTGGLLAVASVALISGRALASDHQDTPEVELNQQMDINDLYVFPGSSPDRIVLALTTASPITPGSAITFSPDLLYQIKIDNTGDAVEDKVIQVWFEGTGANQKVHVRGPVAPAQKGTMNTLSQEGTEVSGLINATIGSAPDMQVFAGLRDDPFWIDLETFFRIIPDRKPVSGSLSQLPDQPTASAWRNPGVDFLKGLNTLAIVVEIPTSRLTSGGNAKIGVWGTISR